MTDSTPAHVPPFALDGTVTREKLHELLAVQTELPWLDFKAACDLSGAAGLVELTKDVGAMMLRGGYLVVGVDDSGTPVGLSDNEAGAFDEASLAAQVAKYITAPFELRTAVHDLDDGSGPRRVAVVWVAPHPDGWCVFKRNGDYTLGSRAKTAFRTGDVYARHGTRSEPWGQPDIAYVRDRLIAREKDTWRAEHAEEMRRALQAATAGAASTSGPSATFTWQLDAAGFENAAVELLRHDDDVPIRRMLRAGAADAQRLVQDGDRDELLVVLDRFATLAALALDLDRPLMRRLTIDALLGLFNNGVVNQYAQTSTHVPVAELWLRITERLYALGALAVRLERWDVVRELALARVPALERESRGRSWHRHTLTEASRAKLLKESSLLLFGRAVAAANPVLRPDVQGNVSPEHGGADPLLTSLAQFDFLAMVICGAEVGASDERQLFAVSYPNFARADGSRVNAIVPRLIREGPLRAALLCDVPDRRLAVVLDLAHTAALREARGYWGWEGYSDQHVVDFLRTYLSGG